MTRSLKKVLDEANPNKVPSALQEYQAGKAFELIPRYVRGTVSSDVLELPEEARAAQVLAAHAIAGSATGYVTPQTPEAGAGSAGQCAVTPDGNVIFNSTDAVTDAEVWYVPREGEIFEETVDVTAGGAATLLQSRQAVLLLEAELLDGSSPGSKTIVARGSSPSAGEAALDTDGLGVSFASADVGSSSQRVRVKYYAQPGTTGAPDAAGARLDSQVEL
jgi:hypothetical protein